MDILKYIIVFFIGLIVGHFNGVFIHILPENKPFFKYCTSCSAKGIWFKVITGTIFVLLYAKYGLTADFIFFAYLLSILIIMFFVDIKTKTIPNTLVLAGLAGGALVFLYNIFHPLQIYDSNKWWEPLIGLLPGSGFLLFIAILGVIIYKSDEVMGMGDVKIFAPIGIFLGWKMCTLSLLISMFLGGLTSILLIVFKIKKRKDTIPFGPFIAIASLIVIIWGKYIWTWYFSKL
jgi:leader peptidase (prepilin peptidase)/N-methyltransferase